MPRMAFSSSPFVSSGLLVILIISMLAPSPVSAAHSHLFPSRDTLPQPHFSHTLPSYRLTPRQILKSRQARTPPSSAVQAAHRLLRERVAARELRILGEQTEATREAVGRAAERVRRLQNGAGTAAEREEVGGAIHDDLYNLLAVLSGSSSRSSSRRFPTQLTASDLSLVSFPLVNAAVAPSGASPSPRPSRRASKRSQARSPNPTHLLHSLLSTLDHILASATSVLPYLPTKQQRQEIEAVVEELREEGSELAQGVKERLGPSATSLNH